MDEVRVQVSALLKTEQEVDRQKRARIDESSQQLRSLLIGGAGVDVLLTLVLASVFSRQISGRLSTVAENAGRLADGEPPARPATGDDEIARLDRVVHDMAATLHEAVQKERDVIENARQ